jgi:hypothetical protein
MAEGRKQVATRISEDAWEVLQIGLLIEGVDSVQDLLRPVVEKYAASLEQEAEVREIREQIRSYKDRRRGVTSLPAPRSAKGKGGRGKASDTADQR